MRTPTADQRGERSLPPGGREIDERLALRSEYADERVIAAMGDKARRRPSGDHLQITVLALIEEQLLWLTLIVERRGPDAIVFCVSELSPRRDRRGVSPSAIFCGSPPVSDTLSRFP